MALNSQDRSLSRPVDSIISFLYKDTCIFIAEDLDFFYIVLLYGELNNKCMFLHTLYFKLDLKKIPPELRDP